MMRRNLWILFVLLSVSSVGGAADIPIGLLSFDTFIPASGSAPGVNAFELYNFSGPNYGPSVGPPYASESLTFEDAILIVNFVGGASQNISLGNIGAGELLDSSGNPLSALQFPSTDDFSSAVFSAALSPTTFGLSDSTTFTGDGSITADLTPSSGPALLAGTDFGAIDAAPAQVTPVPEPANSVLIVVGLIASPACFARRRMGLRVR